MPDEPRGATPADPAVPLARPDGVDHRTQDPTTTHPVDRDGDGRHDLDGRDDHLDHAAPAAPTTAKEMAAVQRARYGGLHMGTAFFGWVAAIGIAVILLALLSAAGLVFGLDTGVGVTGTGGATGDIGLAAAIAVLVVLFLAYLAGGYVAGRMARFDGVKQGLGVWLWGVLAIVLAAVAGLVLGAEYNVFARLDLPALPIDSGTVTTAALVSLGAFLVATLLGALLGGRIGSAYHRRVDRAGFEPRV